MSYKRINKPKARKMYNKGYPIQLLPCKVSESVLTNVPHDFDWIKPVKIQLDSCQHQINKFDRTVNEYVYYNCNAELGYYPHYYVTEEDLDKFALHLVNEIVGGKENGIEESKQNSEQ